jgi:hypothetical protein
MARRLERPGRGGMSLYEIFQVSCLLGHVLAPFIDLTPADFSTTGEFMFDPWMAFLL